MSDVSIRDLRNHGGEVLDRVMSGESLTVTRSGTPVATLVPIRRRGPERATLLKRWQKLPALDPESFREDVDSLLDSTL